MLFFVDKRDSHYRESPWKLAMCQVRVVALLISMLAWSLP